MSQCKEGCWYFCRKGVLDFVLRIDISEPCLFLSSLRCQSGDFINGSKILALTE